VTLDELKQRLDTIAWQEQVEAELSEKPSLASPPDLSLVDQALRALALQLGAGQLDQLEGEAGYLVWCLRLAAYGDPVAAGRCGAQRLAPAAAPGPPPSGG
jgi:hypothetical protein